jgi:hypothetical protein
MYKTKMGILITTLAVLAVVTLGARNSSAQTTPISDTQKTNYVPNANLAGANAVNVTDTFEFGGGQNEIICAGFYVFDENEQLQECCGCPISEDGLLTILVDSGVAGAGNPNTSGPNVGPGPVAAGDLVSNPFNSHTAPGTLNFANIKIISFNINPPNSTIGFIDPLICDATGGNFPQGQFPFPSLVGHGTFVPLSLTPSLRAWATHLQNQTNLTESEFRDAPLSQNDANNYANWCGAIQFSGSGRGVCSCGNDQGF